MIAKVPSRTHSYPFNPPLFGQPLLELAWPAPLLIAGIAGITQPVVISLAFVLALVPWVIRWLSSGRLSQVAIIGGPLVLWGAGAILSLAISYDRSLSWPAILTLLGSISLFFAVVNIPLRPRQIGYGVVSIAALGAIYFVGQYAHFQYLSEQGWTADLGRLTGSFLPDFVFFTPHPNAVAGFLEGALLLGLVLTWQARGGEKLWWGGLTIIIGYGLLVTGSRGSWVGLAVVACIGAILMLPKPLKAGVICGTVVIGIFSVLYLFNFDFSGPAAAPVRATSWQETTFSRLTLYRNSLFLWLDYPFTGIGPGETFAMVYSRYQLLIPVPFLTYPHNLFLALGLSYGLIGLLAFAWLLFNFYRLVFQVEYQYSSSRVAIFRAAWLGVTALLIHGLTDSPQFSEARWTMPMLFGLLGLSVAAGNYVQNKEHIRDSRDAQWRGWLGWGLWGTLVLGIAVVIGIRLPQLLGAWYTNIGAIYQTQADLSPSLDQAKQGESLLQALRYFEKALTLHPTQPGANRRIGMIALENHQFEAAVPYLEQAYQAEPSNQATLKLLGLAYLWVRKADPAEALFRQLDNRSELVEELNNWQNWWARQDREDLSEAAGEMARRLVIR